MVGQRRLRPSGGPAALRREQVGGHREVGGGLRQFVQAQLGGIGVRVGEGGIGADQGPCPGHERPDHHSVGKVAGERQPGHLRSPGVQPVEGASGRIGLAEARLHRGELRGGREVADGVGHRGVGAGRSARGEDAGGDHHRVGGVGGGLGEVPGQQAVRGQLDQRVGEIVGALRIRGRGHAQPLHCGRQLPASVLPGLQSHRSSLPQAWPMPPHPPARHPGESRTGRLRVVPGIDPVGIASARA